MFMDDNNKRTYANADYLVKCKKRKSEIVKSCMYVLSIRTDRWRKSVYSFVLQRFQPTTS